MRYFNLKVPTAEVYRGLVLRLLIAVH